MASSVSIGLVSLSARVTSVKSAQGIPGSDENVEKHCSSKGLLPPFRGFGGDLILMSHSSPLGHALRCPGLQERNSLGVEEWRTLECACIFENMFKCHLYKI